jgi:hypothetical protein
MGSAILRQDDEQAGRKLTGEVLTSGDEAFDKIRELTRNGYLPDADPADGGGILLRHSSAPDLVLRPDGSIDLPLGQRAKIDLPPAAEAPADAQAVAEPPRMAKLRILVIVILAVTFWFLSVAITAGLLEGL